MRRDFLRRTAGIALASLALPHLARASSGQRPLRLAGWSKPITEVINLLAEDDLGFFRANGMTLTYLPGAGGGDAIRNLLSGQADVAFTDPGSFFAAIDKGEPLRAIYDVYPQNVFNVVSLSDSGIRTPADLKGKRIGVYSLASGTRLNLQLLLQQAGVSEQDVEVIVTGVLNFVPLMQGRVDATAATDTGLAVARQRGLRDAHVIDVADHVNYSSDILVVRESLYREDPALLRQVVASFRDSVQWMIREPQDAAQRAQRLAIDGQDVSLNREIIDLRILASQSDLTRQEGLGTLDAASLQTAADAYHRLGLIARPIVIADVIAPELLKH